MKAGESLAVAALRLGSDSVLCMVLECSAFLQHSKVLFPAHGPVFSSPVRAPHNWGLCSLWSSELRSIYARQAQCRCPACGTTWIHWPFNLDSSWDLAIAIVSVVLPHYLKVLLQGSTFVCSSSTSGNVSTFGLMGNNNVLLWRKCNTAHCFTISLWLGHAIVVEIWELTFFCFFVVFF